MALAVLRAPAAAAMLALASLRQYASPAGFIADAADVREIRDASAYFAASSCRSPASPPQAIQCRVKGFVALSRDPLGRWSCGLRDRGRHDSGWNRTVMRPNAAVDGGHHGGCRLDHR
jgi:hypothetical protein